MYLHSCAGASYPVACCKYTYVLIPDEVVYGGRTLKVIGVDDEAFYHLTELTGCVIGKNVATIGQMAFSGTTNLAELTVPANVESIAPFALYHCGIRKLRVEYNKKGIKLGVSDYSSVTTVPSDGTFTNCPNLEEVYWDRNYVQISDTRYTRFRSPFFGSKSLKRLTIGANLDNSDINWYLFGMCENLEEVTFEEGANTVTNNEFYMCKSLKTVNLPSSMRLIQKEAFQFCESLETFDIPEGMVELGEWFLSNTAVKELTLPESVKKIDNTGLKRGHNSEFPGGKHRRRHPHRRA